MLPSGQDLDLMTIRKAAPPVAQALSSITLGHGGDQSGHGGKAST